ncbi:uncharacterized protein BDV17DRAFT_235173 [Aspergillus undulatus]|uniref:uncharacterized protein n=1 Tax=Aspergillus undulatus TaxID=1810928 RepID=UPI003CCDCBEF
MPSSSSTLGWTFANWGSAPTAWPTPNCTPEPVIYFADDDDRDEPDLYESCPPTTLPECWPEPTNTNLIDDFLGDQRNIPYYSPGVNCPSGWEAVGTASRSGDRDASSTGIFTVNILPTTGFDWLDDDIRAFGHHDALGALLDPDETAIACCPSSMTVGDNGICYSTLSNHPISTACFADYVGLDWNVDLTSTTFVWHGTTRTGVIPTTTIPRTPTHTTTRTIEADETSDLVAATQMGPIYLVHRPGDEDENNNNNNNDNSDSNSNSSSSSDSENADETGAASRLYLGQTTDWAQVKTMAGVLGLSLVAGMGLVIW